MRRCRKMAVQQGKLLQAEADIGGSTVVLCMAETAATRDGKDAYQALKTVNGLIFTGATGTNVNDVAVALVE